MWELYLKFWLFLKSVFQVIFSLSLKKCKTLIESVSLNQSLLLNTRSLLFNFSSSIKGYYFEQLHRSWGNCDLQSLFGRIH
jgi:hypothetical protein